MYWTAEGKHTVNTSKKMGLTLIELIVCTVIIGILSSIALPLSQNLIRQKKEEALRENLQTLRRALDRFRDQVKEPGKPETECYPKNLSELVEKRVLRRIPIDPFTGKRDWGIRSSSDPVDAQFTDEKNVFDVFSKSDRISSKGNPYSDW